MKGNCVIIIKIKCTVLFIEQVHFEFSSQTYITVKICVIFYISTTKRMVGKLLGSLHILPVYLSISKAESEKLKRLLMKVKEESKKVGLKLNI